MAQVQNLINIEKALKEFYLPLWQNQLTTKASIIMSKVKKIKIESHKIVSSAPIGLSGGFGFGAEGQNTPAPGAVNFERFNAFSKDMYCDVGISIKATKLTGTNGSMADALHTEIEAAYEAAKWNVGRSLFGNGMGILAEVEELATAGNTIPVDTTKNLIEGLIVDFYASGSVAGSVPAFAERRITAVDRENGTITVDGEASVFVDGFITVQKSFMRELTGLGTIFDDSVTSLYGVSKATEKWINPVVKDGSAGINDVLIMQTLREAGDYKNSNIDMILCGNNAFDSYVAYLRSNNIRVENNFEIVGGFRAIKYVFSDREVLIANERFMPTDEMWGFETGKIEFHSFDWFFADLNSNGSMFTLLPSQSVYRALLCNYGELICKNPGGCVRIHSIPLLI